MLQFLRKSVSSWLGIGILVLALGALVFTLFQPTGPGGGSAATGPVMANVGDAVVGEAEFVRTMDRAVARERETNPDMTLPDFVRLGGGEIVLEQLISGRAIEQFGVRNGMTVSRRVVDGEIASIPAAQLNGKFDEATFRRLLAEQRITEDELRDQIATDIKRKQLLAPVALGSTVARGMAEPFARLLLEVRRGAILAVPSAAMPEPAAPTDADLQAFHEKNRKVYTIPERRAFRYAMIDNAALAQKAKPTPAQVEAYYKANPGEFGGLETRVLNQIVLRDEATAKAVVAGIRGGQSFADAAQKAGFSAEDSALGELSEASLAAATTKEVAAAAFALQPGKVSDPVKGPLGFHVIEAAVVNPPRPQPLATVAAAIESRLAEEKVQDLLAEAVASAEDRMTGGETFADVAKDLGLTVETVAAITADGRQYADDLSVTKIDIPLIAKVFAADPSDGGQVVEADAGRFALLEISDVVSPTLVPLERIRADVATAWGIEARSAAAKAAADAIAAEASAGAALTAAAAAKVPGGLPQPQMLSVRRLELSQMAQQGQQVPPPVVMLLNTPKGQARVIAAPGGQGWFVVKVDAVEAGDIAQAPQLIDAVRQSFLAQAGDEMVQTFVRAIERDVGVVKKPEALAATKRRVTGADLE